MAGTTQDYLTGFTKEGNRGDIRDQGAPKEFVGHTFRDSAGNDWRWNTVHKKYYRSYGESPGQKLQLSAMNRLKEAGKWFRNNTKGVDGQTDSRGRKIGVNPNQWKLDILQSQWDEAETEEDRASVRDLLVMFNAKENKGIIKEDTGMGTTTVIPGEGGFETFSQYRNRIRSDEEYKSEVEESNNNVDNNTLDQSAVTNNEDLNKQESSLKISDADRKLGSTPWARKSLMDSPRAANEATWKLLEEKGYDLRGVRDKDRLAADYRLGRLQETDKGLWYENKFLRNK